MGKNKQFRDPTIQRGGEGQLSKIQCKCDPGMWEPMIACEREGEREGEAKTRARSQDKEMKAEEQNDKRTMGDNSRDIAQPDPHV